VSEASTPHFKDIPLTIPDPYWGSPLATTILELEKLRVKELGGPVPPHIFFQVKSIFQILESLGSARIEGNNTTLTEFVERIIEKGTGTDGDEQMREIRNIEDAITFIEENVVGSTKIDRALVSQVHKILVDGLTQPPGGEGSRYPGQLRGVDVTIQKSSHEPPGHAQVPALFDELIEFVNQHLEAQYHLLAVAISHHRMAWIHPFDNGNGRLVRIFTYALLIKQGFQVKSGRILNPTAIFCMDRNRYYEMLALADSGEKDNVLEWCAYVLDGLRTEIEKIDKLLDITYITGNILIPALAFALERQNITRLEYDILGLAIRSPDMAIRSADLDQVLGGESSVQRSRILRRLRDKGMLIPLSPNGRVYTLGFSNNYLLRGVVQSLKANGFIPASLEAKNQ
jgi:Fic family protein